MSVISKQKYRPDYHFTPAANWMNDPNGLVYFKGEYHLFYQHHPFGTTWGPMHWGHAISKDLVNWEHLPIALKPDEHGTIFSGSAVVDWKDTSGFFGGQTGLVAIFTHHDQVPGTDRVRQRQSLAYSTDAGRSWTKYAGNPVLENEKYVDFRDPKVFWHEPSGRWVMILASGQTVCIYTSPDLMDWTLASEFGQGIGSHDGVWECPDLFPLPVDGDPSRVKWVMLVSVGSEPAIPEGSRIQYFTGGFDGKTFAADEASQEVRWLDYGRDNYAGVTWSDIPAEDGRRLFIGWMSNGKYANVTPTEGWRSAMTLPRELYLETRNGMTPELVQKPVRELERLRTPVLSLAGASASEVQLRLPGLQLDSYEIVARVEAHTEIGFKVRTLASAGQETWIGYSPATREICIDRTRSGKTDFHEGFPARHTAVVDDAAGPFELRIYVDRSSVEVFAGGGQAVMTDLIFPDSEAKGLELVTADENACFHSFEIYSLARMERYRDSDQKNQRTGSCRSPRLRRFSLSCRRCCRRCDFYFSGGRWNGFIACLRCIFDPGSY